MPPSPRVASRHIRMLRGLLPRANSASGMLATAAQPTQLACQLCTVRSNFDPQTTRQLLYVAYARMLRHNLVARGLSRTIAYRRSLKILWKLAAGEKSILGFSAAAAERRKRDGLCVYCGAAATSTDHLIPRLAGGPEDADNHVPACRSCNSSTPPSFRRPSGPRFPIASRQFGLSSPRTRPGVSPAWLLSLPPPSGSASTRCTRCRSAQPWPQPGTGPVSRRCTDS